LAGLGVVDVVGAWQDREADGVADDRAVRSLGRRAHVTPPGDHRAGAGQELLEGSRAGVGIELVGRFGRQRVDNVLDGATQAGLLMRGFIVSASNSQALSSGCLA
jgi:hypothetical protein